MNTNTNTDSIHYINKNINTEIIFHTSIDTQTFINCNDIAINCKPK